MLDNIDVPDIYLTSDANVPAVSSGDTMVDNNFHSITVDDIYDE